VTYRDRQRLADIQAAIDAIRSHLQVLAISRQGRVDLHQPERTHPGVELIAAEHSKRIIGKARRRQHMGRVCEQLFAEG
jgi:hypothetical protein